jgi:hypothetical protein
MQADAMLSASRASIHLAPILFLFFNADLVQSAPRNGSSMAFVDDGN